MKKTKAGLFFLALLSLSGASYAQNVTLKDVCPNESAAFLSSLGQGASMNNEEQSFQSALYGRKRQDEYRLTDEELKKGISYYSKRITEINCDRCAGTFQLKLDICQSNYLLSIGPGGKPNKSANNTSGPAANDCDKAIAAQEQDFNRINNRPLPEGATPPLKRVMYMASKRFYLLKESCPATPRYNEMREQAKRTYTEANSNCEKLTSGGGKCSPEAY